MKEKFEELNVPLSSINFKKNKRKSGNNLQEEDGEVLFEPIDAQ